MKKSETSRRDFITISVAGAAVGTLGIVGGQSAQAFETRKNRIKIAGYDYDRVRAIMDGQVGIAIFLCMLIQGLKNPRTCVAKE